MNSILLLLFVFCNASYSCNCTYITISKSGRLWFKPRNGYIWSVITKIIWDSKSQSKGTKQRNCKNIKACNNQNMLFIELMKARRSNTFPNLLSIVSPSPNTTKDSTKSNFLKTWRTNSLKPREHKMVNTVLLSWWY